MAIYRAAVIGLGKIGMLYDLEPQRPHPSTHVFAYEQSSDFDLVCGIDGDMTKQSLLHKAAPDAEFFSSIDDAVQAGTLKKTDVISICTPPSTHLDIVLKLIDAGIGKVIFCEKPIVRDIEEADKLIDMIQNSGVKLIPNISRRWNTGLRKITEVLQGGKIGKLEKINIRYTRGIYNTGAHLFDLMKMWTGSPIKRVMTLGETQTSAYPEKTFSFYFEMADDVKGYAEAVDDSRYYMFDIDLYCSDGKIEMRSSGDDIYYYVKAPHHLFQGFNELVIDESCTGQLNDSCIKNAIENIRQVLEGKGIPNCSLSDAVYPLYVANALEESFKKKGFEEVKYE